MPSPLDQSSYQVRFDWGRAGLARLAPSDVVVIVDVLRFTTSVTVAAESGAATSLTEAPSSDGASVSSDAGRSGALVLAGCLRNAGAVGERIRHEQVMRDRRTSVAVIAAGNTTARDGDEVRFAVEDLLGAGAVIDALIDRGLDHTSPEAAASAESFRGLRAALHHLVSASGSARELRAHPERFPDAESDIGLASAVDSSAVVAELRDGHYLRSDLIPSGSQK
ncbi:hypothetical protein GCM10025768_18280 [Microbacterium pseudoresistens]|uniref:Probable 2-phosphosulfolactate phosphatase n=1 Tax=Microbacterium pseudoresistens TaxID=640634 RepID=A0A7Y9JN50_9MICO|nr:2-phosphosulfolactate phosphatase [Microbacterium pseudoresistens]NYD55522.1 2-phosphosulfolactate phosphatase [Microbacterium pseudoresistens]